MSYIELLLHEYHMSLRVVFFALEVEAGLALLEARACRINPKAALGYVDRAVFRARDAEHARLERQYKII